MLNEPEPCEPDNRHSPQSQPDSVGSIPPEAPNEPSPTSSDMPLIMDNAVPMDMEEDLFGESVGLLPMRPQSKHIRQRLDEMRTRGCCQ